MWLLPPFVDKKGDPLCQNCHKLPFNNVIYNMYTPIFNIVNKSSYPIVSKKVTHRPKKNDTDAVVLPNLSPCQPPSLTPSQPPTLTPCQPPSLTPTLPATQLDLQPSIHTGQQASDIMFCQWPLLQQRHSMWSLCVHHHVTCLRHWALHHFVHQTSVPHQHLSCHLSWKGCREFTNIMQVPSEHKPVRPNTWLSAVKLTISPVKWGIMLLCLFHLLTGAEDTPEYPWTDLVSQPRKRYVQNWPMLMLLLLLLVVVVVVFIIVVYYHILFHLMFNVIFCNAVWYFSSSSR